MFTGIIEELGEVVSRKEDKDNLRIQVRSKISNQLGVGQSVSHNGVCLTVDEIDGDMHWVSAISETIKRSNLGSLNAGDMINIERAMLAESRFDGHMVQGHVDETVECLAVSENNGSWLYTFKGSPGQVVVEKGSICINGVSLTVAALEDETFQVAIIPTTYDKTTFKFLKEGDRVNIEFDMIGKYIAKMFSSYLTETSK